MNIPNVFLGYLPPCLYCCIYHLYAEVTIISLMSSCLYVWRRCRKQDVDIWHFIRRHCHCPCPELISSDRHKHFHCGDKTIKILSFHIVVIVTAVYKQIQGRAHEATVSWILLIIDSGYGLLSGQHQAITCTNHHDSLWRFVECIRTERTHSCKCSHIWNLKWDIIDYYWLSLIVIDYNFIQTAMG